MLLGLDVGTVAGVGDDIVRCVFDSKKTASHKGWPTGFIRPGSRICTLARYRQESTQKKVRIVLLMPFLSIAIPAQNSQVATPTAFREPAVDGARVDFGPQASPPAYQTGDRNAAKLVLSLLVPVSWPVAFETSATSHRPRPQPCPGVKRWRC